MVHTSRNPITQPQVMWFDSSFHWRSSTKSSFTKSTSSYSKAWLQMIYMTYTNVENCIKGDYPNHGLSNKIYYGPKKKKLNNNNKITNQSFKLPLFCKWKHHHTSLFLIALFDAFFYLLHCYIHLPIQTYTNTCTQRLIGIIIACEWMFSWVIPNKPKWGAPNISKMFIYKE